MKLSVAVLQLFLLILNILSNYQTEGKSIHRPNARPNPQVVIGFAAYQDPTRRGTLGKCFFKEFANRKAVDYYLVKFYWDNELKGEYTIDPNREDYTWRTLDVHNNRVAVHRSACNYPEYSALYRERYGDAAKGVFSCAVQIGCDGETFYSNKWNTSMLPVIPTKKEVQKSSSQRSSKIPTFWGYRPVEENKSAYRGDPFYQNRGSYDLDIGSYVLVPRFKVQLG